MMQKRGSVFRRSGKVSSWQAEASNGQRRESVEDKPKPSPTTAVRDNAPSTSTRF